MDERVRREGDRGMRVGRVSGLRIHSGRGLRKREEKTLTLGGNGGGDWSRGGGLEREWKLKRHGRKREGPRRKTWGKKRAGKRNGPESPDEVPGALPSPVLTTQTPQRVAIPGRRE
jgi:hypothetical protein